MTTDEQYVPSEDEMRHAYWLTRMLDHHAAVDAAFDRFLARVRRDAEGELDSWMARAYEAEGKLWKAEARVKAVRELHSESRIIPGTPVFGCAECGEPNETEPCATIRALEE